MTSPIRAVLFDLDGTLLDTAPDLAHAVNAALGEAGYAPLPVDVLRPHVSAGAGAMLRAGLEHHGGDAARLDDLLPRMLRIYRERIADHTRFFDGMESVLDALDARRLPWGIVTNKLGWLTDPLLEALHLSGRAACVISGDTLAEKKPHPLPLLEAARRIGHDPAVCVYLGDASCDIEAGQRAGMRTLAALYGYLADGDNPQDWGANACLRAPRDLLPWLERHAV